MGKSPHSGGAGPLFPEACSGIPGEGHGPQGTRGPEGHGGQGKEGPEAGMRPQMGTISRNAGGRPAEDTGMCRLMLSPQNKDSLPAADGACGLRCSGPRAAGRAGERPSGLGAQKAGGNCLVLGHCTAHLGGFAGRRTKESPRRAGAFRSEGGQRQDMTDAAV